jgi:beta-glucosidase
MKKASAVPVPVYKNPDAPVISRVKDLLARMTLEEKAAQMVCLWQEKTTKLQDANGDFDLKKAKKHFGNGCGLGQVARPSDAGSKPTDAGKGKGPCETAELTNVIQKFFAEHARLGIPVIFHEECLHGPAAIGATSFSQPIGLGATFNPKGFRVCSGLIVGLLFGACTLLLICCQINKRMTIQMADELTGRRSQRAGPIV